MLLKLTKIIKEDFVWLVTCGEIMKIKDTEFLKHIERKNQLFLVILHLSIKMVNILKNESQKFNRFYKYKIPILNLSSCIII